MSPTMQRLADMAQGMPCDVNNPEDLKSVLATCGMDLLDALDNNRIEFKNHDDRAIFFGLMTVVFDVVMEGKLKNAVKAVASKH